MTSRVVHSSVPGMEQKWLARLITWKSVGAVPTLGTILLAAFLALPAMAKDADYYQRTATKPPINGEWLVGFGVNYVDKLGVGGSAGYHFKDHGITLLGQVSAIQLQGENGSTDFRRYCQTFQVPYSTGDRTEAQYALNVLFTLKKYK